MAKYIGKDGFDVILQFLKETNVKKEKAPIFQDQEMSDNKVKEENLIQQKCKKKTKEKMIE